MLGILGSWFRMSYKIKALYLYVMDGKLPSLIKWGPDHIWLDQALLFYRHYRHKRGKFFCRHRWMLNEVVPDGQVNSLFGYAVCLCEKCGKLKGRATPEIIDDRLIDYSRHISWM